MHEQDDIQIATQISAKTNQWLHSPPPKKKKKKKKNRVTFFFYSGVELV